VVSCAYKRSRGSRAAGRTRAAAKRCSEQRGARGWPWQGRCLPAPGLGADTHKKRCDALRWLIYEAWCKATWKGFGPRARVHLVFALKKPSLPDQSFGGLVSAWLAPTDDEACRELCTLTGGDAEEVERCRALAGPPPSWWYRTDPYYLLVSALPRPV